ncbi:hypothetical protein Goshw_017627 [Gossypium schwendimanii]|uniref:Uncharacterized protein n=1 Tax=Gossypium schwendimanii TaxID=34291 RepID=A0A7J9M516_GOSSC|nr:hypothetical protein [Gossypium schwendimanii]
MMKEVGYKRNWCEVATSPPITPRRSSSCPRLETILEEGSEHKGVSFPSKKVFLLIPVVLSTELQSYNLLLLEKRLKDHDQKHGYGEEK